ncbi:MAG TPA: Flp pilus assembly protein CpaB [Caulobacteraceae bacterium]|nr:Flp pilus assembly protein CpaB [Caulobacteraceae bacterium]
MRTGTLISLGASVILGLAALLIARFWMPQSTHAVSASSGAAASQVPVVVARGPIAYGAKLQAGALTVVDYPAGSAPQGAFSTIQQVIDQPGGAPIALVPMASREPVLPTKLSGAGAKPTVAAVIAPGMRAFTVGVSDVTGAGGHILPGDRVDVVLTYDLNTLAGAGPGGKRLVSTVVLQDVRVLGIDLNADPNSTQAQVAHTATLEVTVEDAQKLALAAQAGTLSLALRRTGGAQIDPVQAITVAALGPGAPAGGVRHFGPRRPRILLPPGPAPRVGRSVIIVEGDTAAAALVPSERGGA